MSTVFPLMIYALLRHEQIVFVGLPAIDPCHCEACTQTES